MKAVKLTLKVRVIVDIDYPEWTLINVSLNKRIVYLASNQTFSIEQGVERIPGALPPGRITNKNPFVSECDIRRGYSTALLIFKYFNTSIPIPKDRHT